MDGIIKAIVGAELFRLKAPYRNLSDEQQKEEAIKYMQALPDHLNFHCIVWTLIQTKTAGFEIEKLKNGGPSRFQTYD